MAQIEGYICDMCKTEYRQDSCSEYDWPCHLMMYTEQVPSSHKLYGDLNFDISAPYSSAPRYNFKKLADVCPKCTYAIKTAIEMIRNDGPDQFIVYDKLKK